MPVKRQQVSICSMESAWSSSTTHNTIQGIAGHLKPGIQTLEALLLRDLARIHVPEVRQAHQGAAHEGRGRQVSVGVPAKSEG